MTTIVWIAILVIVVTWGFLVDYTNLRTTIVGDEFACSEEIDFIGIQPWKAEPDFRVLFYSKDVAKAYYFSGTGVEKALFVRIMACGDIKDSQKHGA